MVVDDMMFVMGGGVMKKTISVPTREVSNTTACTVFRHLVHGSQVPVKNDYVTQLYLDVHLQHA